MRGLWQWETREYFGGAHSILLVRTGTSIDAQQCGAELVSRCTVTLLRVVWGAATATFIAMV